MADAYSPFFLESDVITGIQPHGFMFIVNNECKIVQVSRNIENYLSQPPEFFLFKSLYEVISAESDKSILSFFEDTSLKQKTFVEVRFKNISQVPWLGSIYRLDQGYIIEIEKNRSKKVDFTYFEDISDIGIFLSSAETLNDIYETAVKEIKKITGYERVVFYKFHEVNLAGVVATTDENPGEEANGEYYYDYLYSSSSFRFYNSLIYIPDLNFKSCAFFPGIQQGSEFIAAGQLWATNHAFLNFLKCHKASGFVGVNLYINKSIWGRIACFNTQPREVSPYSRQKVSFIGQLISSTIAMKLMERSNYREATFQILIARLSEAMSSFDNYIEGLRNSIDALLRLGNAEGVAWKLDTNTELFGSAPAPRQLQEVVDFCWRIIDEEKRSVFYTDSLSREDEKFTGIKNVASGVLFLPVSTREKQFVIWFRPERPKDINRFNSELHNENVFKKEKVDSYSLAWNKEDIDNIFRFKGNLTNYIIQNSARLKSTNEKLENLVKERTKVLEKENRMRIKAEKIMKESLEELRRSNGELESFAYVASHDLQEPLRKIQAFSDRLKTLTKDRLDEKAEDYFNRMTAAAKRMQKLINDLLSFSRITTHSNPFEVVDLNELFENVLADLALKIEEKRATVKVAHFDREIYGDVNQLHRVFQNLIQNALKFSRTDVPPLIEVTWKVNGRKCDISVKDNGIGFDKEYSDKIFQLFERLHGRSEYEGTGLGLAICKKIVERHKGKIKTISKMGEGSEFIIELPLNQL